MNSFVKNNAGTLVQHSVFRRQFFDNLAVEMGFNSLDKERWYSVSQADVLKKKVSRNNRD